MRNMEFSKEFIEKFDALYLETCDNLLEAEERHDTERRDVFGLILQELDKMAEERGIKASLGVRLLKGCFTKKNNE